jgi:hypothetical protein
MKKKNILDFGINIKILNFTLIILFIFLLTNCYSKKNVPQHIARKNYNKTINKIHHDVSKHKKQHRKQEIIVFE